MNSSERFRPFVAAYAILLHDKKIFMLRRYKTGWQDGNYSLPAGHVEEGDTVTTSAIREAKEEAGVDIAAKDLRAAHVMYRQVPGERTYVDFFLETKSWSGEPSNIEKEKADDGAWFQLDALPPNIVPSVKAALEKYREGVFFSEFFGDERKQ